MSSQVALLTEQKGGERCLAEWTHSQNRREEEDVYPNGHTLRAGAEIGE